MLLYFSVRNFRSFAGKASLDLTDPGFRTNVPRGQQRWTDVTDRVAAIFGPNAAGKSTVLTALQALATAVSRPGFGGVFDPSLAAGSNAEPMTSYVVGFVGVDGVRYHYEVDAAEWGIRHEELSSYPKGTRRLVFRRSQAGSEAEVQVEGGPSLRGPTSQVARITRPGMLYLATARRYGHEGLSPAAQALAHGVGLVSLNFRDRLDEDLLRRVVLEMVDASHSQVELVEALLRAADLGIDAVEVRRQEIPPELLQRIKGFLRALQEGEEVEEPAVPTAQDVLVFKHHGQGEGVFELPVAAESAGTISWLTTAWHALQALQTGAVLLVDELDASLHPALVRWVVELFQSKLLNRWGAQLVFTSHDVTLLGNAPSRLLEPRTVWFVEKDTDGVSELFSLADFDHRAGNNSEKRYLAGQFGATPDIDEGLLTRFLLESSELADHA